MNMPSDLSVELTDPSTELATLAQFIRGAENGGVVYDGLAKAIGISADDPEYAEVIASLSKRAISLRQLAGSLGDDELDGHLRKEVAKASLAFSRFLSPISLGQQWDANRPKLLSDTAITTLRWFSHIAKKHRPLRVFDEAERTAALEKVQEAIVRINEDSSVDRWMKAFVIDGLERTTLILRFFRFFGHDEAIAQLFLVQQKFVTIAEQQQSAPASKAGSGRAIWDAIAVLSIVGNLLILPDQGVTALEHYSDWSRAALHSIVSQAPPQKLLPAPDPVANKEENAPQI